MSKNVVLIVSFATLSPHSSDLTAVNQIYQRYANPKHAGVKARGYEYFQNANSEIARIHNAGRRFENGDFRVTPAISIFESSTCIADSCNLAMCVLTKYRSMTPKLTDE